MKEIQKQYQNIEKNYGLPPYSEVEKELEISKIDMDKISNLLKEIFRMMISRLANFMNYLEPAITTPPQTLHALIESHNISDDQKNKIFQFYKELSVHVHKGLYIDMLDNKDVAAYFNELWKLWKVMKQKEITFLKIIEEAWKKEDMEKSKESYMS